MSNEVIDSFQRMNKGWFHAWHETLYAFYHLALTMGFSLRFEGGKHLPSTGPALIIANHQSFLDPLIVGLVGRRPLVYLARKTLFRNRYFGALLRSMNTVAIDQEGIGIEGLRTILEQLKLGKAVVIFPEGSRTSDGKMGPLKPGIHLLIRRARVPIFPVGIAGAYDAWPIWRPYPIPAPLFMPPRPGNIAAVLGEPLDGERYARMEREEALQDLFERIAEQQQRAEHLKRH